MNCLVTGGAGFIGSHIVDRLLADGHPTRVLDNFSTGKRDNLAASPAVEIIEGDVGDFATVSEAMAGVDTVFHEAAIASVPETVGNPLASEHTNYRGTLNVLEAARRTGAPRVIFACSAAVYGDLPGLPKREDMPVKPLSPYAVDKLASEYACRVYHSLHDLETVSLRYFNVFGPRQDPTSQYSAVIPRFIRAALAGERPTIYGDGEQSRDFTYVENTIAATLLACGAPEASGETMNVACGERVTLNELVRMIGRLVGKDVEPIHEPRRSGDVRHSQADISKANRLLCYQPEVGLEEGLRRTIEWLRKHHAGN
jgi:nucleoside-diphosphate-sugar epimerase